MNNLDYICAWIGAIFVCASTVYAFLAVHNFIFFKIVKQFELTKTLYAFACARFKANHETNKGA